MADIDWERIRHSRQLARMHDRGLIVREGDTNERRITTTDRGRALTAAAREAHASAVRRALLDVAGDSGPFWPTVDALGGTGRA